MPEIAIIGDIHGAFDETDLAAFNRSDYDLLLFTGDLPSFPWALTLRPLARLLSRLEKPALLIPGNHDIHNPVQFLAAIFRWGWLARPAGWRMPAHHRALQRWLEPVTVAAYSVHPFMVDDFAFAVVTGRPYSMGGPAMSYAPFLRREYGVNTVADSTALIKAQVDASSADHLIFLAHNGPAGLSGAPDSIWGRDFGPGEGDWGDRDLQEAIGYARSQGKEVVAVVAGHMHRLTGQGQWRQWHVQRKGTHYVNCAQVPRIINQDGEVKRHHVRLAFSAEGATIEDRCW